MGVEVRKYVCEYVNVEARKYVCKYVDECGTQQVDEPFQSFSPESAPHHLRTRPHSESHTHYAPCPR